MRSLGRRLVEPASFVACLALALFAPPALASFPGANGRIIYANSIDSTYTVHTVLPSGHGDTVIGHQGSQFTWSPNGRRIAFVDDPAQNIYTMTANGTDVRQLTFDGYAQDPAYAPGGHRIAFTDVGQASVLITVMRSDGSQRHSIRRAFGGFRTWTPDGRLAYRCHFGLCTMRANGTDREHLVWLPAGGGGDGPFYSPDGNKFIFSRCEEEDPHSYDCEGFIANSDGSQIERAPCGINYGGDGYPGGTYGKFPFTYSPDGRRFLVGVPNDSPDFGTPPMNVVRVSLSSCVGKRVVGRTFGNADWQPLPPG
jgi:hypothetical protein